MRTSAWVVAAVLLVALLPGGAAAATSDYKAPPEEIQEIDCPDLSKVAVSDELNTSDYTSCKVENIEHTVLRSHWGTTNTFEGYANWLVNTGESLQSNPIPGAKSLGEKLVASGEDLHSEVESARNQILSY